MNISVKISNDSSKEKYSIFGFNTLVNNHKVFPFANWMLIENPIAEDYIDLYPKNGEILVQNRQKYEIEDRLFIDENNVELIIKRL